jgi:hypothetical protein
MQEKLTIPLDSPTLVRFKSVQGREVRSRYAKSGKESLFTLQDGKLLYLPVQVAEHFHTAKIQPGELVQITKTKTESGIHYDFKRLEENGPANLYVVPGSEPAHQPVKPELTTPQSRLMARQLIAAIEAVNAAEKFGLSINREVRFTSEDIRAIAISCAIQGFRDGEAVGNAA